MALALLTVAGCGGGDRPQTARGGTFTVAFAAFPDYLDPALSYSTAGWSILWNVYTPLLTYAHEEGSAGARLIPGLAERLPDITPDGRTYRLKLRAGLRYSDNTNVRASDFEHTIQRVLTLNSGGAPYFEQIAGARRYRSSNRPGADISGITTDDRTRDITIRLTRADGAFSNILATTFAGLVPGDTPFVNRTAKPPAGVGPYAVDDVRRSRSVVLRRNPRWHPISGVPTAKPDRIEGRVVTNPGIRIQRVIDNEIDLSNELPAPDELHELQAHHRSRFKLYPSPTTVYAFLNTRVAPFDNKLVREAVNYGVDRRAVARLLSGLMTPGCGFVPPSIPGHADPDSCPYGDPARRPDIDRARRLIRAAGAQGARVRVWGQAAQPASSVTSYLADALTQIGLRARPQVVDDAVYLQTVASQKTRAQAGFVSWSADFLHPIAFLHLVDGAAIQPTANPNLSNVNDPVINAKLNEIRANPDLGAVAAQYSALDQRVASEAYELPLGTSQGTVVASTRVDFDRCTPVHPLYGVDLAALCRRQPAK